MSGIDAFLDLCDADPDWDSEEEDDPFERLTKGSTTAAYKDVEKKAAQAKESSSAFQDLFGEPVHLTTNQAGKKSSASPSPTTNGSSSQKVPPVCFNPNARTKPEVKPTSVPTAPKPRFVPKLDDSVVVMDPFTKLRLFKTSIQLYSDEVQPMETSLKERNMTLDFIPIPKLIIHKERKNIWTSAVLVKKLVGTRKSAKGHDYGLWEIHDLDGDCAWTLFLFGTAGTSDALKILPIGSLVDFVNPTVLEDGGAGKFKLSVANTNQVRHIGTAKDFGFCGSRRKDGQSCMMAVNKFKCDVCIHHASAELRKLNGKNKSGWAKQNAFPPGKPGVEMGKPNRDGIIVSNFGKRVTGIPGKPSIPSSSSGLAVEKKQPVRMELQDPTNVMRRNPTSMGNHSSITFSRELNPMIDSLPKVEKPDRKPLNLDPHKTRHLTDQDRLILGKLEIADKKSELPNLLADPNAGSRNYLKFLSKSEGQESQAPQEVSMKASPLVMTRQTMLSMRKALNFVKQNGPISKKDPNSTAPVRKRKLDVDSMDDKNKPCSSSSLNKKQNVLDPKTKSELIKLESKKVGLRNGLDLEVDMGSDEFKQLLNAKSSHATFLEDVQEDEYFTKLERKEAIENKLLSTFSIPTSAVMCRDCKYVALSQSGFCKEKRHVIRVVKATKRFFKCKDCGNRTMSLDRLPKRSCTHCKSSNWLQASVGIERAGPKLDSEKLAIRGDEESYLGAMGAKLFL